MSTYKDHVIELLLFTFQESLDIPITPYDFQYLCDDINATLPTSRSGSINFNANFFIGNDSGYQPPDQTLRTTHHAALIPRRNARKFPPSRYICLICHKRGHFLKHCPEFIKQKTTGLTPYQGKKICFGEFKCPKCKKKWVSSSSWANHGQDCVKCKITVMPNKQWPHQDQNKLLTAGQFHPEHLCGMCKRLGFNCNDILCIETHNKP